MAFDPDAFLLEEDQEEIIPQQPAQTLPQSTGFDPDAFLAEEEEPEFAQPAPAAQPAYQYDPSGFRRKKPVSPEAQKEIGTLEGIANAARNAFDSSRQALDIVGDVTPEEAQNIAKIEFDKQSRKLAPGYDEYQKAEGFDAVLAFAKNPIEVTSNIVAEGLAGSLPALGAGLAAGGVGAAIGAPTVIGAPIGFTAGQVAGTFAGSLATEYGSKILEEMQSEGVDLTKPESIQGFFENEEAVAKARDKAISRGIPVAAFDAISAGIGGKIGRVIGKQFLTKTGEAAAELGVQAGLGGGGEVAGALVAGEPIEGKAVFGEVIGEAGPGAAEIITGRMADRAAKVKAEEEKKIKAAAQLSDNLEQNNAPLTAAAVKSTTATTIEQDKLAAQLEEQLDADEIASQVSGQLAVTKEPTAAPPAIKSKEEFTAIYSQVAPEELDAAEAGFTNTLATAATEEARANAQNALEAIKEVKATVTPPAPTVEPTITPAVTPAVPTAQPPITDATKEIIQPEGVRQEPQDRVEVRPTEEAGVGDSILRAERGQEEGQVVPTSQPIISEIPPTSELVGAEPTQPTIREVPEISPIVGSEPAAIVEQEPVAPAEPAVTPVSVEQSTLPLRASAAEQVIGEGQAAEPVVTRTPEGLLKTTQIGRTWQTSLGQATIQSEATVGGQPRFLVKYERGATELVRPEELEDRIALDVKMYESRQKMRTESQAQREAEQIQKTKYQDFTQSMTPMQASKAFNALETNVQSGGQIIKRGDLVKQAVDEGSEIVIARDGKRRLQKPDGSYRTESQISKTAMDYADYLIQKKSRQVEQKADDRETDFVIMPTTPAAPTPVTTPPVTEAVTPAPEAAPTPAGISVGSKVKYGKLIKPYIVEEVIPQTAREIEEGDQFYRIRSEQPDKNGKYDIANVEKKDIKPILGKGKGKGARKIAAATRNEEYMRLAQDPEANREQLQRMVDEAAKAAGYDIRGYHGTRSPIGFTEFIPNEALGGAIFVATEPSEASAFGRIMDVFIRAKNVRKGVVRSYDEVRAIASSKKRGQDAIRVTDGVGAPINYAVFDPNQIKSADPVTYDDTGNIIPLEERFQPTSPDIRRQAIDTTPEGILITPPDQQYTFNEVFDVAYDMFGGEIPEGFTIVNDSKDKDFEFKAAYIPESGEIIVNLAYLNKNDDIRDAITHELGHYIYGDPEFRAAFDQFIASLSPEARADLDAYVDTAYNKETGEIRLEEKMVRAFVDQFINEEQAPAWRSMLDAIKRFLNKLGFKFNISDRDAISVFTAALDRYKAGEAISREGGARKIIDDLTAMDAEYLAAVERGDMETAQRMVDEAAKKAMPKSLVTEPIISSKEKLADKPLLKVYHGTDAQFNVFERGRKGVTDFGFLGVIEGERHGIFFAENKDFAKTFAKSKGGDRVVPAFLNITMPFELQDAQSIIESRELGGEFSIDYNMARWFFSRSNKWEAFDDADGKAFVDWLESKGFDGAIIQEEGIGLPGDPIQDVWVALSPSQIKSADPVTYDDAGDVIPLSQRFRPTSPDIRRMAAEPRTEQFAGIKTRNIITTPVGITKKTTDVIRAKFFDSTSISPEKTAQAWSYISQFMDDTDNSNNYFAGYINDAVDDQLTVDEKKEIGTKMGAALFTVELTNYAGKLAAQGDTKMLAYMIRNGNKMPTALFEEGTSANARSLNAMKGRLNNNVSGLAAFETEMKSNVERLAAKLFGTNAPSAEQIKIAQDALTESETIELGDANQVAADIKEVETRTNKDILKKIDDLISGYDNPKKDQLLLIFANLIRSRDVDGITISYKPTKVSISDRIANLLVKNLANYRDTLVDKAASGLESTFWRTMSSQENKPGLLGELDQAQNNELAKIVKATLIKMKLAGEPPNTKMTDIEKVASILNESKLSEEKRIEADKRIVAEIGRRRQEELSTTNNPDAVNAKYDSILKAWNDSMSRQLNMPVSDSMLQRLVSAEMKEQNIKIRDLVDEADGKVVAEKKQNIINSIIRKIYGVSKESETGIEMDENYDGLKSYLEQTLDNMYALSVEEKNAAYAKRQAQISLRNTAESQAQSIINRLADQLSDTPAFPQKQENEVKAIVQQDLKQIPDMNRKQPWISQLTAKLMRAGVSEAQAQTISDLVWRQHEIKAMDRESKELQTAAEKGSLAVIIDRIKNTSLERQQSPEWKQEVIKEYLRDAGLSSQAAETAAKLYDSVISERLAAAKQKAFEDTLAKAAPWKNYASRNGRLAKDALKKIKEAIRTGVLDPEKNTESIIAALSGWTGFTKEQYQRIVELDTILNDPNQDNITKREAMDALNKIITKAKMPVNARQAIGAYYVGQALGGIPTATVNVSSPTGFSIRNLMVDIAKYAKTDPARIPIAFESFLDSMRSWYNQTAYAFKNQIYLNDVVEYLNGQNVLRELFDKGKQQWAEGKYAEGLKNMAIGMMQITGRVLSALDQGAISMLENQNITRYAMAALENAKHKVPKNKIREFANMTLDLKRRVIAENIAAGMDKNRAVVLADLAVKSEIRAALSEFGISYQEVLDSAVNDALQAVGRNKVITTEGIKKSQQNISDSGFLSYPPIKFLEWISSSAGKEGPAMQIFSKMVYGFAIVPARTFSTAAWFSPYGFLRLAIDKYKTNKGQESPYAMSLQTEAQYRQRLTDSIAGSIVMLALFAMRSGSSDDEDDKLLKLVITGNGPNATTDKQYYDSWIKEHKPYSIELHFGDSKATINIGRGGEALFFPIMLAGALDDWEIKKKQNLTKKEPSDLNIATEMLGSAFFALAQRGPYAAFTEPLFDASKQGRVTENLVGQLGYFGKTFIPVFGASITRNISDFINDPVDRSSIEGALYANTPIVGPWIGTKALNALGQPIRADDFSDKLFKLGVPVVFSFPKNTPENALNELILKQGSGPTLPTRANAQKRFGDVLTDKEFETYVREYGRVMSDKMFKNRTRLANMKAVDYDDELEKYARGYSIDGIKIKGASDSAVLAVKRMRQ